MKKNKEAIKKFLLLTFSISSIFYVLILLSNNLFPGLTGIFGYLLMWCPAVGAIVISRKYFPKEKILGFRMSKIRYLILGLLIPFVYWLISYGFYLLIFGSNLFKDSVLKHLIENPLTLLLYLSIFFITALGEEIGWRGFLAPKLNELFGFKKTALFSGIIWALWHYPVIFSGYVSTLPLWYQFVSYTLLVLGVSFIFSYYRLRSKSVWPAVLLHCSHNFFSQLVFDQSIGGKLRPYFVGETGLLSIFIILIFAFIITRNHSKKIGQS